MTGSRARVSAAWRAGDVGFDVARARGRSDGALELTATRARSARRPYDLAPAGGGSEVARLVGVRPGRGLLGRLLEQATDALLTAGALDTAVSRIAREVVLVAA